MSEKRKSCGTCGRNKNKQQKDAITNSNVPHKKITKKTKKILLENKQSPGDIVMLTAAVKALAEQESAFDYQIGVDTTCKDIWENNPYIVPLDRKDPEVKVIKAEYPLVNSSNNSPYHFIHGFAKFLEVKLKHDIDVTEFKGDIHISDDEKKWMSQVRELGVKDNFWLVFAGGKFDFTCKWWHPDWYQEVVDYFQGKITFVQVGEKKHWHTPLKNCIDLTGQTNLRQLIRLVYHSSGVLSPVSFGMHAAAAVPTKPGSPKHRAAVVIAGSREPMQWECYPHHRFLSNNGALSCSGSGGCWKSRCTKIKDGDRKNIDSLCEKPVEITVMSKYPKDKLDGPLQIPKCLDMIRPEHVIDAIKSYYIGGVLEYGSCIPGDIPEKAKKYINLE